MITPPTKGENTTKKVDGKSYHWCKVHEAWVRHKPEECRLGNTGQESKNEKKVRLEKSLTAIINESQEDDE